MRILRLLFGLLPILAVLQLAVVPKSAHALTFNPSFGVTLSDNAPSANANVTLTTTQPAGDEVLSSVIFSAPAGWDVAGGSSFSNGAILATGSFTAFVTGFQTVTSTMQVRNDTDLQGHKAHWKVAFISPFVPEIVLDTFLDGNSSTGHSFTVNRSFLSSIETPIDLTLTFNGTVGGTPLMTNPSVQGDYQWSAQYTSPSSVMVTRAQTLSIPGTATPAGTDVTATFNNGSSVTFSSVTSGGTTTLATSETAPPEGSGQFQLSGGLYFDYNTTATFSCPCTITLPYDPVTTPNPRIYHQEDSVWVDVTTNVNAVNHTVTGIVSSFSFFAAGAPNFGLEFMDPVAAMLQESNPIMVSSERTLPVNFTLGDANGDFVSRADVSVQVIDTSNNILAGELAAEALKKHYKANLSIQSLNLDTAKTYRLRVKVGNTTYSPTLLFNIK